MATSYPAEALILEDCQWEIRGGGDPAIDLTDIVWNDDGIGESVRFADLQSYLLVHLPALRDVENDLRNPLIRLIEAFEIDATEQDALIAVLDQANQAIANSATIAEIARAIDVRFKDVAGPAFEMDAALGLSAATSRAIIRNLKIILSDLSLTSFEPGRNGLGMNNILYIAILMEYLQRRIALNRSAGQLILIEEPEAHLHPQLQFSPIAALRAIGVQTILTSHSTQVTWQVPLSSIVSLTKREDATVAAGNLALNAALTAPEIADLERYRDATKSALLYPRKVMLVEGPAEMFLIPALIEQVYGVKLEVVNSTAASQIPQLCVCSGLQTSHSRQAKFLGMPFSEDTILWHLKRNCGQRFSSNRRCRLLALVEILELWHVHGRS